ncbi:MAG TPA: ABC transporter permease [Candidatus Limnocylindria bacterium]|nr:ABC transporter permease [Candidatus Limnocylindria bacterium]
MGTLIQDLRYGIRVLKQNPGFTAVAILTLALGIGANTAIFSVVDAVLLRPLPYPEAQNLFVVYQTNTGLGVPKNGVSYPNFLDWARQSKSFEELTAVRTASFALTGQGAPTYIEAAPVTGNYFDLFRVKPLLGRTLQLSDDAANAPPVVVISERLWRSRFASDPSVVGRTISFDQHPVTVVGIVRGEFHPPMPNPDAELWVPLAQSDIFSDLRTRRGGHYLTVLSRLKAGVTWAQAQAEMTSIEEGLEQQFPDDNKGWGVTLISMQNDMVGDFRAAMLVLLGAVGLVFLIASANVASLQLARAASRGREVAIRVALGAGRSRLVRQFLTECILLSVMGGIAGLALAYATVRGLTSWLPADLPRVAEIHMDARVLSFGLALSIFAGIISGLAPAWRAGGARFSEALKEGARGGGEDKSRRNLRSLLVVGETALAVILLIGSGLLIRSFVRLQEVNTGFNVSHLLTAEISLPRAQYSKPEQWTAFEKQLLERMQSMPGVQEATAALPLPFVGGYLNLGFSIEGRPQQSRSEAFAGNFFTVSPNYFHALQIPLLRGRAFTEGDSANAPKVCAISAVMARKFFPNEDPIGKRVVVGYPRDVPREIVGIVGDVKDVNLAAPEAAQIYAPFAQNPFWAIAVAIRTQGEPGQLSAALREQVLALDPLLPVEGIKPMTMVLAESVAQPRFRTTLLGLFGAAALLLAAIGIYGVISYNTGQRTREIGIRMALGAQQHNVLKLVLREGLLLTLTGVALGLAGALALTRFLATLLFGVGAGDPITFAGVGGLLVGAALLACYVPARRAMRVDPIVALRHE